MRLLRLTKVSDEENLQNISSEEAIIYTEPKLNDSVCRTQWPHPGGVELIKRTHPLVNDSIY